MMAKLVLILANQNALIWGISLDEIFRDDSAQSPTRHIFCTLCFSLLPASYNFKMFF